MSDEEQPGAAAPADPAAAAVEGDESEDEAYGGDMRVAGARGSAAPAARRAHRRPRCRPGPAARRRPRPRSPRRLPRSSDEMDDDEYWSTITFDKPKFPGGRTPGSPPRRGVRTPWPGTRRHTRRSRPRS